MTADGRRVSVLGVPTSAGSHNPGQEKAPAELHQRICRALGVDE